VESDPLKLLDHSMKSIFFLLFYLTDEFFEYLFVSMMSALPTVVNIQFQEKRNLINGLL
jgi:hypothetical protein